SWSRFGGSLRRLREQLLFAPSAAKRFDQLNRRGQALAGDLSATTFGLKGLAVGVHNFEIADDAGPITLRGEFRGPAGIGYSPVLGPGLVGQMANAGQAALYIAERHQHLLAIPRDRFFRRRLGALVVGEVPAPGKDGQGQART